jgi:hypothetical protein
MIERVPRNPAVVVLDVNATLSDMRGLAPRLEQVGAGGELVDLWFAQTLRDGVALAAADALGTSQRLRYPDWRRAWRPFARCPVRPRRRRDSSSRE